MKKKIKLIPAGKAIFDCDCGHPAYLTIEQDDDGTLWLTGMEEYPTLLERIKGFFDGKRCVFEFVLYPQQLKQLKRFMERVEIPRAKGRK